MIIPNQSNIAYNAVVPDGDTTRGNLASNTVNTEVLSDEITKTVATDKYMVREGDIVHNAVTITNGSETDLRYTFISNPICDGASFVEGSVKVNGVAQPTYNIINGFYLPNIKKEEILIVEYDMKIDSPATKTEITDTSEFQYTVTDPVRGDVSYREYANSVKWKVVSENVSVVKSVDKTFAIKGDTLTYTITVTNNGNIDINDIYFTDSIPQGTTFVENSVSVNGVNVPASRPDVGYTLANLQPAAVATTTFQVTVD